MAEDAASGFDLDHTPAQSSEPWTPPSQSLDDPGPRWQCTRCYHDRFVYSAALDSWRCVQCGSFEYESVSSSSYSWTFHPGPPEPPPSSTPPRTLSSPSTPSWTPARDDSDRHAWDFGPPDDWSEAHEAGSESLMTNDPEVDPETLEPVPQKKRVINNHLILQYALVLTYLLVPPELKVSKYLLLLKYHTVFKYHLVPSYHEVAKELVLEQAVLAIGPSQALTCHLMVATVEEDLLQAAARIGTPAKGRSRESAYGRYRSKEELEHADLSLINHKDGIDFILDSLRTPLMTRAIYLKRRYLSEFEQLNRFSGETIRSFCNRYARTERNLRSVQINIESMYDVESRGSRLMDRMRISLDQQRLLLTATGNDLDVHKVREAAIIQFPDHRPTPPVVFSREFDFGRDRDRGGDDRTTHPKGKGKGSHKGKNRPRQTYVTEYVKSIPEDDEEAAEPSDAEPFDGEEAADEDAQEFNDEEEALEDPEQGEEDEDGLQEVIQCLTVTARRLQGLTLGRKYTGKRSIQDRKRTSSGKAKTKSKDATKSANSKKVYAVKFADGVDGHLAVRIDLFPAQVHTSHVWKQLSQEDVWQDPDSELILCSQQSAAIKDFDLQASTSNASASSSSLVASMAAASPGIHRLRDHPGEVHAALHELGYPSKGMDCAPGSHECGHVPEPARHCHAALQASGTDDSTKRQQARPLCKVSGLRHEVDMEREKAGMGRSTFRKTLVAAIALFGELIGGYDAIFNSRGTSSGGQATDSTDEHIGILKYGTTGTSFDGTSGQIQNPVLQHQQDGQSTSQFLEASQAPRGGGLRAVPVTREGAVSRGGLSGRVRMGSDMKKGSYSWLTGHLRHHQRLYENEVAAYDKIPAYINIVKYDSKIDLLELFSGAARLTSTAFHFGLNAIQPFDLREGIDLSSEAGRKLAKHVLQHHKPLLLHVAWPRRLWSLFNENMNWSHRLHELEALRDEERELVRFTVGLCKEQHAQGRLFLGENVLRSRLWQEPDILSLAELDNVSTSVCDAGAYGAETTDGFPMIKAHRWISDSPTILAELSQKLTPGQKMYTKPIEGKDTSHSGEYCQGLVNAILRGLQREARPRNPARFQVAKDAFFVRPLADEQRWRAVLDTLDKRFENTYTRPAWHTVTRRVTKDKNTGELIQDLRDPMNQPDRLVHKKLKKATDIETFFYHQPPAEEAEMAENPGAAEDGPDAEEACGFPSSALVPNMKTDIWFENPPPGLTSSMKASVARLHCNLGHAPKEEVARLLAASNSLSPKLLSALDALRCGSCIRTGRPKRPTTSSTSTVYAGFFGEVLQADIVYHRLLTGETIPALGVVCEATNYHAAKALANRLPATMLEALIEIWYRPLGLPHRFRCDPDGAFQGEVARWHATHGIMHEIVPAEMHNRIGKIERRNALLRTLLERLTDEHACHTVDHLQHLIVAALYSLNACTYTYGRSPFQAVFGKIPRPLGDVVSDELVLVYSPDDIERTYKPEILRADAMKILAETSASQAMKRALLRKTRHTQDLSSLQPGQTVAYWRWSGKARQLKRGSWNLARFLAYDPDRRSCWIQVNAHTLKVAVSQLRVASGWETWSPSAEDVKFLKDAEKNLRDGLWKDSIEGPPGEHEEQFADEATMEEVRQLAPETLPRSRDYWQLTDAGAVRVHVEPRRELYVPQPQDECPLPLDTLADDRQTYIHDLEEQPEIDQWRDERSAKFYEQPWTGTTTFFRKRLPVEVASPEVPAEGTMLPSTASPPTGLRLPVPQRSEDRAAVSPQVIQQQQQNYDQRRVTINVSSPTYQQFGAPATPMPPTPRRRIARCRSPAPRVKLTLEQPATPAPAEQSALRDADEKQRPASAPLTPAAGEATETSGNTPAPEQATASASAGQGDGMPTEALLPDMPAKRPFDAMLASVMFTHRWDIFDDNTMCLKFPGFDGSPDTVGFHRSQIYMTFYLNSVQREQEVKDGDPKVSDAETSDDEQLTLSNAKVRTRQEQKQYEKEIPWRSIMLMDKMTIDKYILAIQKEFDGWQRWSGVQPVPSDEAERIFKDRILRRRVLRSRMAYRDKNRGIGTLAAKARCVLIGCADPDITSLSRDSPTPSRTSEFLLLAILASGSNRRFNGTSEKWFCWISDAKNAFLQGQQATEERNNQPLYMQPPEDPLVKQSGCFAAKLYLVTGNCYGLANAPRVWYKHVCSVLHKHDFKMHDLDRCLFYHTSLHSGEEKIDCALIVHVDDFLAVYSESFKLEALEKMLEWGSVTKLDGSNKGTYRGKEITLYEEQNEWKVKVTQQEFCKTMEPPRPVPGKMDQKLTVEGWKEFRSMAGCLQWVASQSRPELAAVTSLSNKGGETCFRDLKNLGEALQFTMATMDSGIVLPGIHLNKNTIVLVYADSSWANALNFSSQYGVLVTLCPPEVTETVTPCVLTDWKSGRSPRVCRSTLASEAVAADEGTDRGCHVNACLSELLYLQPAHKLGCRMPQKQISDCKSLYDCVVSENPSVSDRRSLLQIRSVQQSIAPADMHWVPTEKMHADGLTKEDKRLRDNLQAWLQSPWSQLREAGASKTKTSEIHELHDM
ncbi:Copia protein (Gag-int-pol protein) [Cleaved into: Copia VLP protein [Durusdinium trenchii]|uniref:Copia protein (Gag-int-pol protein) [Cleaved into: Copia VLP protein n=1 Tax=Durusdinium trenchii TaxID=1381693 RepID=A0ABP0NBK2_9DINO